MDSTALQATEIWGQSWKKWMLCIHLLGRGRRWAGGRGRKITWIACKKGLLKLNLHLRIIDKITRKRVVYQICKNRELSIFTKYRLLTPGSTIHFGLKTEQIRPPWGGTHVKLRITKYCEKLCKLGIDEKVAWVGTQAKGGRAIRNNQLIVAYRWSLRGQAGHCKVDKKHVCAAQVELYSYVCKRWEQ